jgi:hypothetical protein
MSVLAQNICKSLLFVDVGVIDVLKAVVKPDELKVVLEVISYLTTCNTLPVGSLALPSVPEVILAALRAVTFCVELSANVSPFIPSTLNVIYTIVHTAVLDTVTVALFATETGPKDPAL